MFMEIIALNARDALIIEKAGANRIELVIDMKNDGMSPDASVIEEVVNTVSIPVRVMARLSSRSFIYNEEERDALIDWIRSVDHLDFEGYVIGALDEQHRIDIRFIRRVAQCTKKLITFHRAIDYSDDPIANVKLLADNIPSLDCILTSGGKRPITKNIMTLLQMKAVTDDVTILLGGGISVNTINMFLISGLDNVHVGRAARYNNAFEEDVSIPAIMKLFDMDEDHPY